MRADTCSYQTGSVVIIEVNNLRCVRLPAKLSAGTASAVDEPDGYHEQWAHDGLLFTHAPDACVTSVQPAAGALGANTSLFVNIPSALCRFATAAATAATKTTAATIATTYVSATQLCCSALADLGGSDGSGGAVTLGVAVSLNGLDFTAEAAQFELLPRAMVCSLLSARGPATGNTTVLVSGDGLVEAGNAPGQHAHALGRFVSSRKVECVAPPGELRPVVQIVTLENTDVNRRADKSDSSVSFGPAVASAEVQRVEVGFDAYISRHEHSHGYIELASHASRASHMLAAKLRVGEFSPFCSSEPTNWFVSRGDKRVSGSHGMSSLHLQIEYPQTMPVGSSPRSSRVRAFRPSSHLQRRSAPPMVTWGSSSPSVLGRA